MRTKAPSVVLRVGDGRGFVVATARERFVITAAHCLDELPPSMANSHESERTYHKLLAPIDEPCSVAAECLFADPVADIAVLAPPEIPELVDDVIAYYRLTSSVTALRVSELDGGEAVAYLLGLRGSRFSCVVRAFERGALLLSEHTEPVELGMSGSPILAKDGSSIGVVVASGGRNPSLQYRVS
jgi:hypothetical protein